jgi:hypothetical protein
MKVAHGFVAGVVVAVAIGGSAAAASSIQHHVRQPASSRGNSEALGARGAQGPNADRSNEAHEKDTSSKPSGLDNAIAHVSQNLADHPNTGLANALAHLQANKAKHEAKGKDHRPEKSKALKAN